MGCGHTPPNGVRAAFKPRFSMERLCTDKTVINLSFCHQGISPAPPPAPLNDTPWLRIELAGFVEAILLLPMYGRTDCSSFPTVFYTSEDANPPLALSFLVQCWVFYLVLRR